MKHFFSKAIIVFLLVFAGCAKIGSPPGGEKDNLKPSVVFVKPESGSVNVQLDETIVFSFNKKIDDYKTEKFISVYPKTPVEYDWSTYSLEISPRNNWLENSIHRISFKKITDYNGITNSDIYTYIFSTYGELDTLFLNASINVENLKGYINYNLVDVSGIEDSVIIKGRINSDEKLSFSWLRESDYALNFYRDTIRIKRNLYNLEEDSINDSINFIFNPDSIFIKKMKIRDNKWLEFSFSDSIPGLSYFIADSLDNFLSVSKSIIEDKNVKIFTNQRIDSMKYKISFYSADQDIFVQDTLFIEPGVRDTLAPEVIKIIPAANSILSRDSDIEIVFDEFIKVNPSIEISAENLLNNNVINIHSWKIKNNNSIFISLKHTGLENGRYIFRVSTDISDWNGFIIKQPIIFEYIILNQN